MQDGFLRRKQDLGLAPLPEPTEDDLKLKHRRATRGSGPLQDLGPQESYMTWQNVFAADVLAANTR